MQPDYGAPGAPLSTESDDHAHYVSGQSWNADRPRVLVIVCSDGRLQKNIDDFLHDHLGINDYDRLYTPGGPGALASSGHEFTRIDTFRKESLFLIEAHQVEEVILLFHGAAPDGPPEATCADYRRKLPGKTPAEINAQQEADALELTRSVFNWPTHLNVRAYRAEVMADGNVRFVELRLL